jgi:hypothetical protein
MPSVVPLQYTAAPIQQQLTVTYRPDWVNIDHGLRLLAFITISGALEDGQGRQANGSTRDRRLNSANAIRWLRDYKQQELVPFSLVWCCHVLDLNPRTVARNGVARVTGGGLDRWREWRRDRAQNRIVPHPLCVIRCAYCGKVVQTRQPGRRFCNQTCSGAAQRGKGGGPRALVPVTTELSEGWNAGDYRGYRSYCNSLGLTPATEGFWRMVTRR